MRKVQFAQVLISVLLMFWLLLIQSQLSAQLRFNQSIIDYHHARAQLDKENLKLFKALVEK